MNRIPLSQLVAGRYISEEAFLDDAYLLLSREVQIDAQLLVRLRRWRFDHILSDGAVHDTPPEANTTYGDSASLEALELGRQDVREMHEAQDIFTSYVRYAEQLFGIFLQKGVLPAAAVQEKARSLIEDTRDRRSYLLRLPALHTRTSNYIVDHGVKTALIAIAIAQTLKIPTHRIIELATAALLHELGMIRLPPSLYLEDRTLTEKERKAIHAAPVLGFKTLRGLNFPPQICLAVLECREQIDGTGYPRGLAGDRISIHGKIVSVASTYAAMASARPYRPPLDCHTIMKTILTGANSSYDHSVVQAITNALSLFPYGTIVQLASGHQGEVVDIVPNKPRSPKVRILTDPTGEITDQTPVISTEDEENRITGVLDHEDAKRFRPLS
jgi:HD-GYP domain-containing protein (c-di-GMP phosphodiesterase class II)